MSLQVYLNVGGKDRRGDAAGATLSWEIADGIVILNSPNVRSLSHWLPAFAENSLSMVIKALFPLEQGSPTTEPQPGVDPWPVGGRAA